MNDLVRRLLLLGVIATAFGAVDARAAVINISAEFVPNAHDPNKRTFTNTTPWSGVCNGAHLNTCKARGIWSIDTRIRGTKQFRGPSADDRNNYYFALPGKRTVTVTNDAGMRSDLDLRLSGIAFRYGGPPTTENPIFAACPTFLSNHQAIGSSVMRMLLRNGDSNAAGVCINTNNRPQRRDDVEIQALDIVYILDAQNPLELPSGMYRGSTTYTIGGAGSDIDLGNGVAVDSPTLTVNFELEVKHSFRISGIEDGARVVLAPERGWRDWIDHGRAPARLQQELPFRIDTSGRFSLGLQCQHAIGERCGIALEEGADAVPLDIAVTMPGIHVVEGRRPAQRQPLNRTQPVMFGVDGYVLERPSRLHFEVAGQPLQQMLARPGSQWRGDVTLVFDAEP